MRQSKFLNMTFDKGWKCTAIFLAANYSKGTKHNAYRYQLVRPTSDGLAFKHITVSGSMMTQIANGTRTVESIAKNKLKSEKRINEILYRNI